MTPQTVMPVHRDTARQALTTSLSLLAWAVPTTGAGHGRRPGTPHRNTLSSSQVYDSTAGLCRAALEVAYIASISAAK